MKFLSIDHGSSHLGYAIGDDESYTAVVYDTLDEADLEKQLASVQQIVLDEEIGTVVVGFPLTMEGAQGHQADKTLDFIEELSGRLAVPVVREDERMTTQLAHGQQKEGATMDDHVLAAVAILQTFLDRRKLEGGA